MNQNRNSTLQTDLDDARKRSLDWIASMAVPGHPGGVLRSSADHDAGTWPSMLLPGTYNGVMNLALIAGDDWPEIRPDETLCEWIRGFRQEDGAFVLPDMTDLTVFKKDDRHETWTYIRFHIGNYAIGALEALDDTAPPRLTFVEPWLDRQYLEAWLARRDMRDPWLEGNNIVNLASFLLLFRDSGDNDLRARADGALDILLDWHVRNIDPATGFWGIGQHRDETSLLHAMAGATHNYHLFYALGEPVPYFDKAIDYCLSRPPRPVSACIDVDAVDILANGYRSLDHRRADIEAWFREFTGSLLDWQNADGGFPDEKSGWRQFDGWPGGYRERQGISNTFSTWFRWIALAMMAETLWPERFSWRFRRTIGIGYFRKGGRND